MKEIIMPKLGETMEEGYLSKWFKKEGDRVEKNEPLFEVMSDKTNFEVESPAAGLLRKILVPAGDRPVPVITTVAYIADSMEDPLPETPPAAPAAPEPAPAGNGREASVEVGGAAAGSEKPAPVEGGYTPASPLAKKVARELGVDLSTLRGSGPRGRVVEKDVLAAAETAGPARAERPAGGVREVSLSPLRRIIAERLGRSKREIPHYYIRKTIDAGHLVACRAGLKPRVTTVTYTDVLAKAVGDCLREFPEMNAVFEKDRLYLHADVNIGLAVSRDQGLVVPVLKSVQEKTIAEIAPERARLVAMAREDRLGRDDVEGGTFTISNLGVYPVDSFFPIIYQPQVAIMGVGAIRDGVVASGSTMSIRPLMEVTLACDHRVVDGSYSARFLARLQEILDGMPAA